MDSFSDLSKRDDGIFPLHEFICSVVDENLIKRRTALKCLGTEVKLCNASSLLSHLNKGCKLLCAALIETINDNQAPEICRERAIGCLHTTLKKLMAVDDNDGIVQTFLIQFYSDFCETFHSRFTCQSIDDDHNSSVGKPNEEAEEIRLMLVLAMSDILKYFGRLQRFHDQLREGVLEASSLLCNVLSSNVLKDSYPELKRESCVLLTSFAQIFPETIRVNGESLFDPLIGSGPIVRNSIITERKSVDPSDITVPIMVPKNCLLQHRHAKTRALVVRSISEIVSCYILDPTCTCTTITNHGIEGEDDCQHTNPRSKYDSVCGRGTEERNSGDLLSTLLHLHVLPAFETLCSIEHSGSVRIALIESIGDILTKLLRAHSISSTPNFSNSERTDTREDIAEIESVSYITRLVFLLLVGIADETESVHSAAVLQLTSIATNCCCRAKDSKGVEEAISDVVPRLLSFLSPDIILLMSVISNHHSIERRKKVLATLRVTINYLNQIQDSSDQEDNYKNASPMDDCRILIRILRFLFHSLMDEDKSVFDKACSCALSMGTSIKCGKLSLRLLIEAITREEDQYICPSTIEEKMNDSNSLFISNSARHHATALTLITSLLRGECSTNETTENQIRWLGLSEANEISQIFVGDITLDHVHASKDTAYALLDACHTLVICASSLWVQLDSIDSNGKYNGETKFVINIICCCVYLLSCSEMFNVATPTASLLQLLSDSLPEISCYSELFDIHFEHLFHMIVDNKENVQKWDRGNRDFLAFDTLLRSSNSATIGKHFGIVAPIIEMHLTDESIDDSFTVKGEASVYEKKLFTMALVESIVSDPDFPASHLKSFLENLLSNAIIPQLVWKAGGQASALRKLSAAVLLSIVYGHGFTQQLLKKLAPTLFPVLKSNLTDDDATIRELILSSLGGVFHLISRDLGEIIVDQFYPELIKCLDDNNQNVRLTSCNVMKEFLKHTPVNEYNSTAFNYIVENLFIQLDDLDPSFQQRIYEVVLVALNVNPCTVRKQAATSKSSHHNPIFCERIMENVLVNNV